VSCARGGHNIHLTLNFILLTSGIVLIFTGVALLGFYRIHMLEVINIEFLVVPLLFVIGGAFALLTSIFGFYSVNREDSCLMVAYSVMLAVHFLILIGGIVSAVRLLFDIQMGLLDADVVPELAIYETDAWVSYKWNTMQSKYDYAYTKRHAARIRY
jgi:hypothetical protein